MHWNVIDYNKFLNIVFMHLHKQNLIIILAAFSLLSSCVYHFDLDKISEVPKLTVYSYPGSGDTTVVRLSHSLPVYDKGMRMYGLKGRDIRLEVNDIAVPLLWTEDSLPGVPAKSYYVVQPYETSDRVRLTASVEGVKAVSAFTIIPAPFPLNAVKIERKPSELSVLQLQINFTDYAKMENYYAVTVKERVKYWKEGTSEVHYGKPSSAYMDWSDEPILDASSGLDDIFMGNYAYYQNLYFWSDEKIQGMPLHLHVRNPTFRHEWLPHICDFPNASGRAILPTIYNCHQVRDCLGDEERNTCHLSSVRTMHNLYYAVGISFHAVYSFSNHWCESVRPLQLPTILL